MGPPDRPSIRSPHRHRLPTLGTARAGKPAQLTLGRESRARATPSPLRVHYRGPTLRSEGACTPVRFDTALPEGGNVMIGVPSWLVPSEQRARFDEEWASNIAHAGEVGISESEVRSAAMRSALRLRGRRILDALPSVSLHTLFWAAALCFLYVAIDRWWPCFAGAADVCLTREDDTYDLLLRSTSSPRSSFSALPTRVTASEPTLSPTLG